MGIAEVTAGCRAPADLRGDEAVAWVASRQHGVVSGHQLAVCGLSAAAVGHRVRRGRLHRLHRGVYAVGHDAVAPAGRILAAVLAVGDGAVASRASAARLLGLLPAETRAPAGIDPVDVTVVDGRHRRDRVGIRCHETRSWTSRDLWWVGPVPVTSASRTVLDVAGTDGHRAAERMLAQALRSRLATEQQVRSLVARSSGHHGVGVVASLIDAGPAFDRSVAERLLLELVRRAGLPEPRTNARAAGFEVDVLWSEVGLVAEFDSFTFHGDVIAFRADRRKLARLQAAGFGVVPVLWADLQDAPEVVVAHVASALAVAGERVRRAG